MENLKRTILLVTILLFVYNALFTYIIINLTTGLSNITRGIFLGLLALDYIIIFYFILQVANEIKFVKSTGKKKKKG